MPKVDFSSYFIYQKIVWNLKVNKKVNNLEAKRYHNWNKIKIQNKSSFKN